MKEIKKRLKHMVVGDRFKDDRGDVWKLTSQDAMYQNSFIAHRERDEQIATYSGKSEVLALVEDAPAAETPAVQDEVVARPAEPAAPVTEAAKARNKRGR